LLKEGKTKLADLSVEALKYLRKKIEPKCVTYGNKLNIDDSG